MLNGLIIDGKLDPQAFAAALADPAALLAALPAQAAAEEGLIGRLAAFALGAAGRERDLLVLLDGGVDSRDNGYYGLAALAAAGKASPALADAMVARVAAEIAKSKSGGSGMGEQACRVLGILGHPRTAELCQQVIDGDRFCDRFELARIKKAVSDGRDREAQRLFSDAKLAFAEHIAEPATPAPAPASAPQPAAKPPAAKGPVAPTPAPPAPEDAEVGDDPAAAAADESAGKPVDWKAFLASPEAAGLGPMKQAMAQLGPLLEQLAARAIQARLTDLSADEFAALLLQVLPQALPPQHVQMALSPQAVNGYAALAAFLHRTGATTQGDALVQGVRMVRQAMTEQIRAAGIIGGPDYSEPAAKPAG